MRRVNRLTDAAGLSVGGAVAGSVNSGLGYADLVTVVGLNA